MIKQAFKNNINNISRLIYDAIHDIANTLTGEKEEKKILETLDLYVKMDINRLSYKNIWVYELENENIALIIAYNSNHFNATFFSLFFSFTTDFQIESSVPSK